jgi:hypothetical protein
MALIEAGQHALRALELARHEEADRIAVAVQEGRVLGVLGEAEVGKTTTIRQALRRSAQRLAVVEVDLDGVAGEEQLAFLIARKIASTYLGPAEFSTLKVGILVPASIEAKRIELADLLGIDGLEEALRDWPSGDYELARALTALEELTIRRQTILWIDHLEAPALTPRHPLDLDRLLWAVREMVQRLPRLTVVLSGRDPVETRVLGREAAFYEQGQWMTMDNPAPEAWKQVAAAIGVPRSFADDLWELTGGHPETMLLALLDQTTADPSRSAFEVVRKLASTSGGLTARAVEHARSLHRLGGQVLIQVANGQGPYSVAQRGQSPPQEIRKVLGRLQLAGLIRHDDGWAVVNPLIGIVLRGDVRPLLAPDREPEGRPPH